MYATLAQILARYDRPDSQELSRLTAPATGVRDDTAIEAALSEASGQMDLYLGSRNTLPLFGLTDTQAADLARMACDIARYRLHGDQATEEVRTRYDDALSALEQIASGRIVFDSGAAISPGRAAITSGERLMTRAKWSDLF